MRTAKCLVGIVTALGVLACLGWGASVSGEVLVGYEYTDDNASICDYNSLWFCAPEAHDYVWKAIRTRAIATGTANQFILFVASAPDVPAEVGWAVYEDNGGRPGATVAWGYEPSYRFVVGENEFGAVQTGEIVRGRYYWYTVHSSLSDLLQIQRGRERVCPNDLKRGTNQDPSTGWEVFDPPPPGGEFVNVYNDDCYAWAIETTSTTPEKCYCECCGQEIECP